MNPPKLSDTTLTAKDVIVGIMCFLGRFLMIEKGKLYYETPCPECGRFHIEPMLHEGADPESSIAYCYAIGTRTEVTIDIEAATEAMLKSIENRGVPDKYAARAAVDAALVEGGNQ